MYSKEWYRTLGFNKLVMNLHTSLSYRKVKKTLDMIRHMEKGGTPLRTLSNIVEIEGSKVQNHINKLAHEILEENEFTQEGTPNQVTTEYGIDKDVAAIDSKIIEDAINEYNQDKEDEFKINNNEKNNFYEKQTKTVNISIDDVSVKKQSEKRHKKDDITINEENGGKEYIRNTVVHIEQAKEKYLLNGKSTVEILPILIAFLINNRLLNFQMQFFVDGEKSLHNAILAKFDWHKSFSLKLDWYHLEEKCKMELSMALKGRTLRNEVLAVLLKYLWIGEIDAAIKVLRKIDNENIKEQVHIDRLIGYFERNRNYIPCYALRKKLGLRNSSNKGEKTNDILVANRQKHQSMSWSREGSVTLTTITAIHSNKEADNWFDKGTISFKLVS